jgi:hypothetical protein
LDHREGKTTNQCVNQFQAVFLSELVMHYTKRVQMLRWGLEASDEGERHL